MLFNMHLCASHGMGKFKISNTWQYSNGHRDVMLWNSIRFGRNVRARFSHDTESFLHTRIICDGPILAVPRVDTMAFGDWPR